MVKYYSTYNFNDYFFILFYVFNQTRTSLRKFKFDISLVPKNLYYSKLLKLINLFFIYFYTIVSILTKFGRYFSKDLLGYQHNFLPLIEKNRLSLFRVNIY